MTSQTRGRKCCSKNVRERPDERKKLSIHNNPPLTFTPKAFQRFVGRRGVIGNAMI
jgi:hypothetical protein